MVLIESSLVAVPPRPATAWPTPDVCPSVVWLRGDHDLATMAVLSENLARTIADDDADLVVDLRAVTFMGAETVGVLVRARQFLQRESRWLRVRSPSARAMRTLELCEVTWLLDPRPSARRRPAGAAGLGAWAGVLNTDRNEDGARGSATAYPDLGRHRRTHITGTPPNRDVGER